MKRYGILLVAVLLCMACNKEHTTTLPDDAAMRFEMKHPATRATATAFEQGDPHWTLHYRVRWRCGCASPNFGQLGQQCCGIARW